MPTAYSYMRFSSPEQARGDSIRRQTAARDAWLQNHPDVQLDSSLSLVDAGKSGFNRDGLAKYALNQFIEHVRAGRVPKGSFLVCENLDRISRECEGKATELFLSIVNSGVTVVQLLPNVVEYSSDTLGIVSLISAVLEFSRAHGESKTKSLRIRSSWEQKNANAATKAVTRKLPLWIRAATGEHHKRMRDMAPGEVRFEIDPEKGAIVKRIVREAIAGNGCVTIAKKLNAEQVPLLGRTQMNGLAIRWSRTVVLQFLTSPALYGVYVPYRRARSRKPPGEPVKDYYPALVSESEFLAVQASIRNRAAVGRGRRGKHINLFAGLLTNAADGGSLSYRHQTGSSVIFPTTANVGGSKFTSFPVQAFEEGILSQLVELDAGDVLGNGTSTPSNELTAKIAHIDKLIKTWTQKMTDLAIVGIVAQKLSELSAEQAKLQAQLNEAREEEAAPRADAWGALRQLAEQLKTDPSDDLRVTVRAAIRRAVARIHCLFVRLSKRRCIAVAQIHFPGTAEHRVVYVFQERGQPWMARSWRFGMSNLDLRIPEEVALMERNLRADYGELANWGLWRKPNDSGTSATPSADPSAGS